MESLRRKLLFLAGIVTLSGLTLSQLPKYPKKRFPHPISKTPAKVLKLQGACYGSYLSPTGKNAVVLTTRGLYLIDVASQQVLANTDAEFASSVAFSPDGKWLARRGPFGPKEAQGCNMAVYEATTLKPIQVPLEPHLDYLTVSWSSDAAYLAAGIMEVFSATAPKDTIIWDARNWQAPGKRIRPLEGLPPGAFRSSLPGIFLGQNLYVVIVENTRPGILSYYVHEYEPPNWRLARKIGPVTEKCSDHPIFAYSEPHAPDTMFWACQLQSTITGNPPEDPHIWSFSSKTKRIEDWGAKRYYLDRLHRIEAHLGYKFLSKSLITIFLPINDKTLVTMGGATIQLSQQTDKGLKVEELYYDGYPIYCAEAVAPEKHRLVVRMSDEELKAKPFCKWLIGVLDLKTKQRIGPAYHYDSPLLSGCVEITPDGKHVLVAYEDGTLHFWRVSDSEADEN